MASYIKKFKSLKFRSFRLYGYDIEKPEDDDYDDEDDEEENEDEKKDDFGNPRIKVRALLGE